MLTQREPIQQEYVEVSPPKIERPAVQVDDRGNVIGSIEDQFSPAAIAHMRDFANW